MPDADMKLMLEAAAESPPEATENEKGGAVTNMLSFQLLCINELGWRLLCLADSNS